MNMGDELTSATLKTATDVVGIGVRASERTLDLIAKLLQYLGTLSAKTADKRVKTTDLTDIRTGEVNIDKLKQNAMQNGDMIAISQNGFTKDDMKHIARKAKEYGLPVAFTNKNGKDNIYAAVRQSDLPLFKALCTDMMKNKLDTVPQELSNFKVKEWEIPFITNELNRYDLSAQFGKTTKAMLDDYIKGFKERNPNLHIFNAVLHMDEASPHLHIDFIPFYTEGRQKGLSKGVSMKAALDEQGFTAKNYRANRLVAWEESERAAMEKILHKHGFEREDKNAKYAHMSVDEYKSVKDEKKVLNVLRKVNSISDEELSIENVRDLKLRVNALEQKNKKLLSQKHSPYKSFYYSSAEKQAYVQAQLDERNIPYRETENGFEAQECYVEEIRKLEKEFKPVRSSAREKLREDIDKLLMQSNSFDELLDKLRKEKYEVKTGKYIAVRPRGGQQFIRLKSLGENYSELALRNRINAKKKFESELQEKISTHKKKESMEFYILRTVQFYTVTFSKGALPVRKKNPSKPFAWTNDSELDALMLLNRKINEGATLESLRSEFENAEKDLAEKENKLEKSQKDLKSFRELKEKIEVVFENKPSNSFTLEEAKKTLQRYPSINKSNYRNVDRLVAQEAENLEKIKSEAAAAKKILEEKASVFSSAEKICGGTYVQSLVAAERQRREANYIPNGVKKA